ncbi:glycoside hydrolase family 43 protein [Reichenbachiella ulvae]|uniref:Glycoside hydrolase family 43 protein n=1 Tax=Reichenbachiella ulvae TaxID=2980104 RepID=A0ABT3D036_9BACT|nr:glycoside hydrolase family 43 protein [Reichenbachiella ulvae]MCV9389257.1 glycoside hydrolase family 43 protein [Reichenbachiella ulvae]
MMKRIFSPSKLLILLILTLGSNVFGQDQPETFKNPILTGFHPDPSICRVGEDYYLVNSSFEWYPGLPVYHSRDLVNWELIGYGIHRPNQVPLPEGLPDSRGVYAPTIRYHEGLFYIINTCVKCEGNFYITATDPAGPWSEPVWLGTRGIDPEIFWDDDGQAYYVGHANITGVNDWPDKNGAWMQKLDLVEGKVVGERKQLTHGHAKNARWTEGPHIYKINGKYMLLVAEGGTGFHHAITVHHSDSLWGPYIPDHSNPVLTHRHLGADYPVHSVGHGDLVQLPSGEWWFVGLGKRKVDGSTLLARETFLTPVKFEEREGYPTPVFNPGVGHLSVEQKRPDLLWTPFDSKELKDDFDGKILDLKWNFLRSPMTTWHGLHKGQLILNTRAEKIENFENPSFIAQRIEDHNFKAETQVSFSSKKSNESAGLVLYRNSQNHFQLVKKGDEVQLIKTIRGKQNVVKRQKVKSNKLVLGVESSGVKAVFSFKEEDGKRIEWDEELTLLSDEVAGGFNGPYIGMYTTSDGQKSKSKAYFDYFIYQGKDND